MMNTVIRTHVKNEKRLQLLERTILSALDKKLDAFGNIYVLDDGSPMGDAILKKCLDLGVQYVPAVLKPGDTKNGLAESLSLDTWNKPIFCVCDDVVFGKGIFEEIDHIMTNEVQNLPDCGMISLFACYNRGLLVNEHSHLWEYPIRAFYAGVAVIYSPRFRQAYYDDWIAVVNGKKAVPRMCDDLYCKEILTASGLKLYNTAKDYAQHTGVDARTFGDDEADPGSRYISKFFVGE